MGFWDRLGGRRNVASDAGEPWDYPLLWDATYAVPPDKHTSRQAAGFTRDETLEHALTQCPEGGRLVLMSWRNFRGAHGPKYDLQPVWEEGRWLAAASYAPVQTEPLFRDVVVGSEFTFNGLTWMKVSEDEADRVDTGFRRRFHPFESA